MVNLQVGDRVVVIRDYIGKLGSESYITGEICEVTCVWYTNNKLDAANIKSSRGIDNIFGSYYMNDNMPKYYTFELLSVNRMKKLKSLNI